MPAEQSCDVVLGLQWHINKNVQTKAQQIWRDADGTTKEEKQRIAEQRASFMKRWTQVR
jgi:hypothetical protein